MSQIVFAHREELLEAYPLEVRCVEGADREVGPDRSPAAEGIKIVPARDHRISQHEYVYITTSPDALDRIPDVGADAGRFIGDDQDLPTVDALELHRLVR